MQIELTVGISRPVLLRTKHSSPTPSYDEQSYPDRHLQQWVFLIATSTVAAISYLLQSGSLRQHTGSDINSVLHDTDYYCL